MTTNITDYINVRQRASELGCTVPTHIAILPTNFEFVEARTDFRQLSEAATVKTLFRTNSVPLDDFLPHSERASYIQNNSFEWIAPTLFISSSLLIGNPAAVSVALGVLSNYITEFLKGLPGQKRAKLDIVVERRGDMSCKKISYEGDVEGISSLADIVRQISNE